MLNAYKHSSEEVIKFFGADSKRGFNKTAADASRAKYGVNELSKPKRKSIFVRIFSSLLEPMMFIMLAAFIITIGVNVISFINEGKFDIAECIGIGSAIILSVSITIIMEGRSQKAFDALNKMQNEIRVKVLRGGAVHDVPRSEIVCGDIIVMEVGDKVPVDARLIESLNLEIDESPLTGESVPVKKSSNFIPDSSNPHIPLAERKNMVYGGCFVTEGRCRAVVTAVGDDTELGKIAKELGEAEIPVTPLQQKLDKLGKVIAGAGSVVALIVFLIRLLSLVFEGGVTFHSVQEIFVNSIILIVASVPEGLPTIVAVSLALNVIKMAKENALVKRMIACETVGAITVICSDKTGTLTENRMTLNKIVCSAKEYMPDKITDKYLLSNIAVNSTAELEKEGGRYSFIGNPTEGALLVAREKSTGFKYQEARAKANIVHVYPFSSDTKRMTTIVKENGTIISYVKGAPEIVLEMCGMDSDLRRKALSDIAAYQADSKRIIALCHGFPQSSCSDYNKCRGEIERNLVFDGFAVISDPVRKEVYGAVDECKKAGIGVKMLTGDNLITAKAIAKELKIITNDAEVVTAGDIENMPDEELKKKLSYIKVIARSTPMTKLRIVNLLKQSGQTVALTGDGINDAPALKAADVGIAMGISGTEVTKEAADIVLLDDSFSTIVSSVEWGRGIYENFQRFIMFQLTVNVSAVLITIICILSGMDSPFNSLQLLWINLIMDGPPGLTLGLEPIREDLMKRRPIARDTSIVTKKMFLRIMVNALFIATFIIIQAGFNFMGVTREKEKTIVFTTFIIFQLFNAFNARELGSSSVFKSFLKNKLMLIVLLITFALQIVITQFGGPVFGTVALSYTEWLIVMLSGFSIILFNELYKAGVMIFNKVRRTRRLSSETIKA